MKFRYGKGEDTVFAHRKLLTWLVAWMTCTVARYGHCAITVKGGGKSGPQVIVLQQMIDTSFGDLQTELAYTVKLFGDELEDSLDDHPNYFLSKLDSSFIQQRTPLKPQTGQDKKDDSKSANVPWYEQRWAGNDFLFNMKELKLRHPVQKDTEYTCLIPNELNEEQLKASRNEWPEQVQTEMANKTGAEPDSVEGLMAQTIKNEHSRCLLRRYGYWSYRVCPNNYVEQIHAEKRTTTAESLIKYSLGMYHPEKDSVMTIEGDQYYIQKYENGDESRKADVRYTCAIDILPRGVKRDIIGYQEPSPLHYVLTVGISDTAVCGKLTSVRQIMKQINGSCSTLKKGWWNYEVCLGSHVKQYHLESKKVASEFLLGKFNKDIDTYVDEGQVPESIRKNKKSARSQPAEYLPAIVQQYDDGTHCDVSMQPRQTEVRIQCGSEYFEVSSIKEVKTCQYIVFVTSIHVCEHPSLKQIEQPEIRQKANINCVPSTALDQRKQNLLSQ